MYHPTGRVLTVLELLQSRPGMTGPELARRLEIDVRSVRRYVEKLQDIGIPVQGSPGRYGGYYLRPGYKLPPLIFSEEEATAVLLGLAGFSLLNLESNTTAIEGALSKISRVLPEASRKKLKAVSNLSVLTPDRSGTIPRVDVFALLSLAIGDQRQLSFRYPRPDGGSQKRQVEPYHLAGRDGKWYLVAFCLMRQDFRTFRLDRLRGAELLETRFQPEPKFDPRKYVTKHLGGFSARWKLKVVFRESVEVMRKKIPPRYGKLTAIPDGTLVESPASDLDHAARYLMLLSVPFYVKGPVELKTALAKLARESAAIAQAGP